MLSARVGKRMNDQYLISIIQTRKVSVKNWGDAEAEAKIWSLDERASGYSVSILPEEMKV